MTAPPDLATAATALFEYPPKACEAMPQVGEAGRDQYCDPTNPCRVCALRTALAQHEERAALDAAVLEAAERAEVATRIFDSEGMGGGRMTHKVTCEAALYKAVRARRAKGARGGA